MARIYRLDRDRDTVAEHKDSKLADVFRDAWFATKKTNENRNNKKKEKL